MTHISDLHDYGNEETQAEADRHKGLLEGNRKAITAEIEQIVNNEFDRLEKYASEFICQTAAYRAQNYLEKVLAGDEKAAAELLDADHRSRYRQGGYKDGEPWPSLIHGRLFLTRSMELRKAIVEAHADLIRNERIADLEAAVDGLTQQLQRTERDLESCRNRYRD